VLTDERGFSLVEMLVTASMLVLILTATLGLFSSSSRIGQSDLARDQALNDQTAAFSRMVNEIRQAYAINCPSGGCTSAATSTSIDFDERVYESGAQADRRVAYNCGVAQPGVTGQYECVRYEAAATDTTDAVPLSSNCSTCTSTVVIQNVVNTPVFSGLTTGTSGSGTVRWVSGQATIYTPANGALSSKVSPYKHDIILSQSFSMPQLQFGQ
jgi:prepilin-type N-terminal cleavage/methylation domain-containing protein